MPIINGQGRIGVRVQVPLLLDNYGGAIGAYSLRKLSNTYNGPAIRVRRSSNNAELNIGFNSDGTLDTTTLLSFVGAGDGYVVTIYDQSGSQNSLSWWQAVTQSKIVSNGVIETLNGKPCINSTGISSSLYRFLHPVNGYTSIPYKTLYFVGKVETASNFNAIINSSEYYDGFYAKPNSNTFGLYKHDWATPYPANPMGQRELTFAGNSMNPFMVYVNMRDMKLYAEHNGGGENLLGNWGSAMGVNYFLNSGGGMFNGKFTEMILWNSDKSANRSAINSNINSYYSIYSPTPSIVSSGLILNLDAGNAASYPGTGTVWTDLSGQGNHATLVNGVGYSSSNGGYLTFDGSNDYVNLGSNINLTGTLTYNTWIKTTSSRCHLIGAYNGNGPYDGWAVTLGFYNSGKLSWWSGSGWKSSTVSCNTNTWVNVTVTFDGSNVYFYLNGVLGFTTTSSAIGTYLGNKYIGGGPGFDPFLGQMSQVSIYNRALTDAEVLQNYNALKSRYGL